VADDLLARREASAAWRRHALRLKTARAHGRRAREGVLPADPRALDGADPCPLRVVSGDQGRALRPVPGDRRDPGLRIPRRVMAASYSGGAGLRNAKRAAAHVAALVREAPGYGVAVDGPPRVDFGAVMARMRRLRAALSPTDSASRFRSLGVDVYFGDARFVGPDTVDVGGQQLRFSRAVVATGSRAATLPVAGLAEAGFLTNETIFSLTDLPRRLLVVGAGPIGCELAQAFRRLGSEVAIVSLDPRLLPREDPDAAAILTARFEREQIALHLGAR